MWKKANNSNIQQHNTTERELYLNVNAIWYNIMRAPNSLSNAPRSKWGKCNCNSNTHKPKFDGVAQECEVGRGLGGEGGGVLLLMI